MAAFKAFHCAALTLFGLGEASVHHGESWGLQRVAALASRRLTPLLMGLRAHCVYYRRHSSGAAGPAPCSGSARHSQALAHLARSRRVQKANGTR